MTSLVGDASATYPYSAVTYIEVTFPDGTEVSGSGAVIGQNDVLTASHVIFSEANGGLADSITVYPGRDGERTPYGAYEWGYANYFEVDLDNDGLLSREDSETDLAVIGLDERLGLETGTFGTDPFAESGTFNLTGYPFGYEDLSGPRMTNDRGRAEVGAFEFVWDYIDIESGPGTSGGPLWYEADGNYYIAGVASTGGWATDIYAQSETIANWVDGNDFLLDDNRAPVARADTVATPAGEPVEIAVRANDSDPDGDPLRLEGVTPPGHGMATTGQDGTVTYTPDTGFTGTDSFTYTLGDGAGGTDTASVTVDVEPLPITGTPNADNLLGTAGDDEINAFAGDDILRGFTGNDALLAGDGRDRVFGGAGDDRIVAGASPADRRDVVYAGAGDDVVYGGHGNDALNGGAGEDTLAGQAGADQIRGNADDDVLSGGALSDLVFGGPGSDFVNGGFGFDRVNGGDGDDRFFHVGQAGHGSDWIQDYDAAEGDQLVYGGETANADFRVITTETSDAGRPAVDEAFVVDTRSGQILWALVDGAGQNTINLSLDGQEIDLLA